MEVYYRVYRLTGEDTTLLKVEDFYHEIENFFDTEEEALEAIKKFNIMGCALVILKHYYIY